VRHASAALPVKAAIRVLLNELIILRTLSRQTATLRAMYDRFIAARS
jgi:hypothetical protein